ncbi:Protein of unknown function (DUF2034) domain containing protein [Naviculisporaceae sp. PSN 640]
MNMLLRPLFRNLRTVPRVLPNSKAAQSPKVHTSTFRMPGRHYGSSAEQSPPSPTPETESSTTTGPEPEPGFESSLRESSPQATNTSTPKSLEYPSSKSAFHNDLPSFLQYASRVGLSQTSTVFVGTHFEYTVASTLSLYGFNLRRIGGASDAGVDLLGTWTIPSVSTTTSSSQPQPQPQPPLRVIIQCKVTPNPRPSLIRELEGAFIGAPSGWRMNSSSSEGGVLGFLILDKPATRGIREALGRSRWPMGFIYCSKEGIVEQFLWNERAVSQGLEGMGVVKRYASGGQQVALTNRGKMLPFVNHGMTNSDG